MARLGLLLVCLEEIAKAICVPDIARVERVEVYRAQLQEYLDYTDLNLAFDFLKEALDTLLALC